LLTTPLMTTPLLTTPRASLLDCADPLRAGARRERKRSTVLAHGTDRDRRHVAVVITTDSRRVQMPIDSGLVDVSLLLRSLALGLESVLALITGSRRENGGTRRDRDR
jgi:hypothetical protein